MAIFSVALTLRVTVMVLVISTVWLTVSPFTDELKAFEQTTKMQEIAEMVEAKVVMGLSQLQDYNTTVTSEFVLPPLDKPYFVSLSCADDSLIINVSAPVIKRNFIINDDLNCSGMDISGTVPYNGMRCLTGQNYGQIMLTLVGNCAIV